MKVRAIINFNDLEENEHRIADKSEWECSEERAKYLLDHKAVELVVEEDETIEPTDDIKEEELVSEVRVVKHKKKRK